MNPSTKGRQYQIKLGIKEDKKEGLIRRNWRSSAHKKLTIHKDSILFEFNLSLTNTPYNLQNTSPMKKWRSDSPQTQTRTRATISPIHILLMINRDHPKKELRQSFTIQ